MQNANLDITFEWNDIGLSYFTHEFLVTLTMIPSSRSSFKVKDKYKNHSFRTNGGGWVWGHSCFTNTSCSKFKTLLPLKIIFSNNFFWYFSVFVPEKHQNISTDM